MADFLASWPRWTRDRLLHAWAPSRERRGRDLTGRALNMASYGTQGVTFDARGAAQGTGQSGLRVGAGSTYANLPPQAGLAFRYPLTAVWAGSFPATPSSFSPTVFSGLGNSGDGNYLFGMMLDMSAGFYALFGDSQAPFIGVPTWVANRLYVIVQRITPTAMDLFIDGSRVGGATGSYAAPTMSSGANIGFGSYPGWNGDRAAYHRFGALYGRRFSDDAVRLLSRLVLDSVRV